MLMIRRASKSRRNPPAKSRSPAASAPPAGDPSGLLRRLGALVYDAILMAGVLFAATLALLPLRGGEAFHPHDLVFSAYLLIVGFVFCGWFWTHGGQTLGMRAWKIRLLACDGGPVSWRRAAIRYLCAWMSLGLFGLGYLWVWLDPHKRSWHDWASGTHVIRQRQG
jgi:uncharacterized RDD family membrane protein YckC